MSSPQPEGDTASQPQTEDLSVMEFMSRDKIAAGLWLTRMITVVSAIIFLWPTSVGGVWYQRAVVASAATSALRLHQRMQGQFRISREFLYNLLQEDACHYLIFSICFLSVSPVTVALVPIFLFALLHSTAYLRKLLALPSLNGGPAFLQNLITKIETNSVFILRFIALNEILLMPVVILMLFNGAASLFIPFIYYRFLTLRYLSRRNPYCRSTFTELRISAEGLASNPSCPGIVRSGINNIVSFLCRLAPQTATAQ
jgi:hypothetical protein